MTESFNGITTSNNAGDPPNGSLKTGQDLVSAPESPEADGLLDHIETEPEAGSTLVEHTESVEPLSIDEQNGTEDLPVSCLLESLLFVVDTPVAPEQLATALGCPLEEVEAGLATLQEYYSQQQRGIRLQRHNGQVQLVTAPAAADAIEAFLNLDLSTRLSGPALETLAVIAYRQPVARAQIEAVRGVDCSGVLRTLLQHGLIEEVSRMETVGRPILYGVTDQFLQHFGITSLDELPALPSEDADALQAALSLADED